MNIIFFSRLFFPHIGGVEAHICEIGKRLIKQGNRITVVTERYDKSLPTYEKYQGFDVYRIPFLKSEKQKKYEIWKWLWQHKDLVAHADVVHCHDVFFWYLPFRLLYPFNKVFTTFHGYETNFPVRKKAIIVRKLSEILSNGNICVGDFIKKWYFTKPSYTTYGGVNKPTKIAQRSGSRKMKILFLGRVEEDNGVYIYAEVLQILKNKEIEFELTVLGNGKEKKILSRYGEIKGFIKNVDKYIAEADIVFTSSYLSILQAFSHQKLVVSTYTHPLKEDYLRMSPFADWIVIEQDPIQLAHKVIALQKNIHTYDKNIEQAYEWAKEQTWERVTDTYLKLWKL